MLIFLATLSALIWLYLLGLRGGFWRSAGRDLSDRWVPSGGIAPLDPPVAVVMPARNERAVIARAVASVLAQRYDGPLRVILIDDHSTDGTAEAAAAAAALSARADALTILAARDLPPGWAGKVWAMAEGLAHAQTLDPPPDYVLFTDADIEHGPDVLARLIAKAESEDRDLVSLMVRLHCESFWERLLIPPFVFFFRKLYPFAWVNDPTRPTAAAAGGCMLLRRDALERIGGFAGMKGAIIDDCTLAARIARGARAGGGRLWLGLTQASRSIRPYTRLGEIWSMVARSAYTQLRHSPLLLLGTVAGMALLYLAPPVIALTWPWHGVAPAGALALATWLLMAAMLAPTLRLYGQPVALGATLPLAGLLYCAMTVGSALAHWRGRGGAWKGRVGIEGAAGARRPG